MPSTSWLRWSSSGKYSTGCACLSPPEATAAGPCIAISRFTTRALALGGAAALRRRIPRVKVLIQPPSFRRTRHDLTFHRTADVASPRASRSARLGRRQRLKAWPWRSRRGRAERALSWRAPPSGWRTARCARRDFFAFCGRPEEALAGGIEPPESHVDDGKGQFGACCTCVSKRSCFLRSPSSDESDPIRLVASREGESD